MMRIIALLALIFGFLTQGLLDGQVFTHAIFGIVCGITAMVCGLTSARKNRGHASVGWFMAGLGFLLGIWCVVMLPSFYRQQQKFNDRREQRFKTLEQSGRANQSVEPTGGSVFCFDLESRAGGGSRWC